MNNKMIKMTQNIKAIILALLFVFGISYVQAAWTAAPASPPSGNVDAPLNVGNVGQSKAGGLTLNSNGATYGLIVLAGNVGIGTAAPTAKLEVVGTVKITGGTPAAGKVLTATDTAGNATWGTVTGGGDVSTCQIKHGKITGLLRDTTKAVTFDTAFASGQTPNVVGTPDVSADTSQTAPQLRIWNVTNTGFSVAAQANTSMQYVAMYGCNGGLSTLAGGQTIRWDKWVEVKATGGAGYVKCNDGWIVTQAGHYTSSSDNENTIVRCTRVDPTYSNPAFSFMASGGAYTAYTINATSPNPYTP